MNISKGVLIYTSSPASKKTEGKHEDIIADIDGKPNLYTVRTEDSLPWKYPLHHTNSLFTQVPTLCFKLIPLHLLLQ